MVHAIIFSGTIIGVDGLIVEVEVDLARGIPSFTIVGLPNTAVRESRERVTSAVKNSGFRFPLQRITVNLAPADVRKEGVGFDLAIAAGIIVASAMDGCGERRGGEPPARERGPQRGGDRSGGATRVAGRARVDGRLGRTVFLGELALGGAVRPVRGVLPVLLHASRSGYRTAVVPADNFAESRVVRDIEVYGVHHLDQAIALVGLPGSGGGPPPAREVEPAHKPRGRVFRRAEVACLGGIRRAQDVVVGQRGGRERDGEATAVTPGGRDGIDMADVRGQEAAKRALLIAAAGGHHVLMVGPPGAGKTMLARRFATLLPLLDDEAALETTMIYSSAGLMNGTGLIVRPPYRAPHHSASDAGMIGGGAVPRPGEVTLAHNGVLFLDELPEFRRNVLETLREPLEEGRIVVSRARHRVTFPARFQLVAAMNPCPCGQRGNPSQVCRCTPAQLVRYRSRVSGPLLDRVAIQVFVRPVDLEALERESRETERSEALRRQVEAARARQRHRLAGGRFRTNAEIADELQRRHCKLEARAAQCLSEAQRHLRVSARGRSQIIRVARTIADLADRDVIGTDHIAEALQYRLREADFG